ncbi:MAG: MarR family transcriptional regulator [Alphaproteobacteria bacterium]|nr:MarR family transcriptional regulator [Alphaproteobacteria bacterium]
MAPKAEKKTNVQSPRAQAPRAQSAKSRSASKEQAAKENLRLEEFLPFQLAVVANRASQMIAHVIEDQYNLQVPDWRILVTLDEYAPLSPNEIAGYTSMDNPRVSRAQRRLTDLRLVRCESDPHDGRRKILTLTPLGKSVCRKMSPEARSREAWLLEGLSAEERASLADILRKLKSWTENLELADSEE